MIDLQPVIGTVNDAFLSAYTTHCENLTNEAMIKFKGRSAIKRYLPPKPTKRGIEAWVFADAKTGIMCGYTGRSDGDQSRC